MRRFLALIAAVLLGGLALDRVGVPPPFTAAAPPSTVRFSRARASGLLVEATWTRRPGESHREFANRVLAEWDALTKAMEATR